MHCLANRVQVVVLVLKHVQLNILLRVFLDDSFGGMAAFGILVALHHFFLVGGQLGKHFLVLGPDWFLGDGWLGGYFFSHVI